MKKFYTSTVLSILTMLTYAQPQFTASNCFQLNDSSKIGFVIVSQSFDDFISPTGSNYTWDFTTTGTPGPWTSWVNPTTSYKFRPSSQSNHTPFALTQINEYALLSFSRDHFYTYSTSQDTLFADGFYNSSNKTYLPRIPYLTFPLSYSDSVYNQTTQTGGTALGPGLIKRYWIYDGFGTVKLPYGTESNVYRIRTKQIDSSSVLSSILSTSEELIWFRQDGIPILRFVKQGTTLLFAYYTSISGTSGINEDTLDNTIGISPNPFSDEITLSNFSNKKIKLITLYDTHGRLILKETNIEKNSINTDKLSNGLYIIEVTLADNLIVRKKVIK